MSSLTQCNYCSLKGIRRRAKSDGNRVVTCGNVKWTSDGGLNVYVMPPEVAPPPGSIKEDSDFHDAYFVAWFMAMTDGCVC